MQRRTLERVLASTVLFVAGALLLIGAFSRHKVYDPDTEQYGIVSFTNVSDADLVIDATFGGTTRKGDRLYSTYDRGEPRGKRACPT